MSGTLTLSSTLTRYRATLVHFRYNIPGVPPNRVDSKRTDGTLFAQTMSFYCDFHMETSWLLFWDIGLESPAFFTPYSIDKKRSCHSWWIFMITSTSYVQVLCYRTNNAVEPLKFSSFSPQALLVSHLSSASLLPREKSWIYRSYQSSPSSRAIYFETSSYLTMPFALWF